MRKVTTNGSTVPVAFVTNGRQRLKQYSTSNSPNDGAVYLRNGDEFELELFNPTTDKVMAKIELNGISIGAGVVLRPGERVFIERYLDEAKKFLFQTYEVEGDNQEVKRAIANNGNVRVLFYKESLPIIPYYPPVTTWTTSWPTWGSTTFTTNNLGTPTFGGHDCGDVIGDTLKDVSSFYSASLGDDAPQACMDSLGSLDFMEQKLTRSFAGSGRKMSKSVKSSKSVETGRIDKGSHSSQSFGHDYSTFDTYWTWKTEWKILPLSQKPMVSEDIKVFCTNCGTRQRRSSHKFCPNCGTEF